MFIFATVNLRFIADNIKNKNVIQYFVIMWLTIVYIVLLLIGIVGYACSVYIEARNDKLRKEGKEVRKKAYLMDVSCGLFCGILAVPVLHLTEKWLSPYITSEAAMFLLQLLILIVLLLAVGIPVRRIAKR